MKINIYIFLLISVLLKIALAYFVPVFGDETYYYIWSLHPQLSYFDHPPMVSWFISIGHLFLPAGNPVSLRVMFIISGFITSLLWILILRFKEYSERAIMIWLTLFFLNPLLGPGSILATPDTPLVLFWTLSFYCLLRLLKSHEIKWYSMTGIFLGLGFCSKYHIVLFVISGLIYLLLSKQLLKMRPIGVLLTILFGAVFSLPVLIWNANNNWSSFLFQINHGFGEVGFEWAWPAGYLIAQLLIVNPFIVYSLFLKGTGFLDRTFSVSQLLFFFSSSFKSVVEGNWPLTSHLHSVSHFCETAFIRFSRFAVFYWAGFYFMLVAFLVSPFSTAVKKNLVNSTQLAEVLPLVDTHQPLFGPSYQFASLLSWKTQKIMPKLKGLSRLDFYDSLPESSPANTSFFVLKYDISDWPKEYEVYKKIKIQSFDNINLALYQFIYE